MSGRIVHPGDEAHARVRVVQSAAELANEALAADYDEWICYDAETTIPFEEWLHTNRPSVVSAANGIGWIYVQSPTDESVGTDYDDVIQMQKEWSRICQQPNSSIDHQVVRRLADKYNVKTGKWLFYVQTGLKVDINWKNVAKGVVTGALGEVAISAKVSPFSQGNDRHVVCVYNKNFLDEEEIFKLEGAVRDAGVLCELKYKPDAYTYLGIYRNNEWGLRPCIYSSVYDARKKSSSIQKLFADEDPTDMPAAAPSL